MKNIALRAMASWILGGLLLCSAAFYNGFPLVYSDTGEYILEGFTGKVSIYNRPMPYGLFLRHSSLATSLWYVILAQGLLLSSLTYLFLKHFNPRGAGRPVALLHLAVLFFLLWCSGISVRTSQLMPDVFAPMPALALCIILYAKSLRRWEGIYLSLIAVWAIISHTSHLIVYLFAGLAVLVIWLVRRWQYGRWDSAPRRMIWALSLIGAAWLALPGLHAAYGVGFTTSRSSPVFFLGQLNYVGILPKFLKENCTDDSTYFLCPYRHELPVSYWWDSRSPIYKTGGWRKQDQEAYQALIDEILADPRYSKLFLQSLVTGTFHQFFNFDTANTPAQKEGSPSYPPIKQYFAYETNPLSVARQWRRTLDYTFLNNRQRLVVYGCFLLVLALAFRPDWTRPIPEQLIRALVLIVLVLVFNAAVCGGLSNGAMRYQNRLIWLLPFIVVLIGMSQQNRLGELLKKQWRGGRPG